MAANPPPRGARGAPSFDGSEPDELPRYFEDIETIVSNAGLQNDADKIRYAEYYATIKVVRLWRTVPELKRQNPGWNQVKIEITKLYPSLEAGERYSRGDLEELVAAWGRRGIRSRDDLGLYKREFIEQSDYLITNRQMSEVETQQAFIRAFTGELRTILLRKLEIAKPLHKYGAPYDIDDVVTQANLILGGSAFWDESTSSAPRGGTTSTERTTVKKEEVDLSTVMDTLKSFQVQIDSLQRGQVAVPPFRQQQPFSQRPPGCSFCSEVGHYIRQCPRVLEFVQAGKCIRDPQGKVLLPNGNYVNNSLTGRNIMERVENYHRMTSGQPSGPQGFQPHTPSNSVNFVDVPAQQKGEPIIDPIIYTGITNEIEEDEPDIEIERLEVLLSEAKKKSAAAKKAKFETPDKPKPRNAPPAAKPPTPSQSAPQRPDASKTVPTPPQYKYTSAIEDPTIAKNVLDRTLDAPITVSQRELLALAPEVRKQIKDLTTTKKIATNNVNLVGAQQNSDAERAERATLALAEPEENRFTAWETLPLRTMEGIVDDKLPVEFTLDQGASCCLMREDVWKRIGTHLLPDKGTMLETANLGVTRTLGQIPNAKITLGGIDFSVPMQVVSDGPFLILLGRPFFAVSRCETKDYASGEQTVTLTDPADLTSRSMIATGSRTVGKPVLQPDFQ